MSLITVKHTDNPTIIKFEFRDFIAPRGSHQFNNIDEAKNSPLAKQLFHLPFIKTVFISGNFIAIERYNIVEWADVENEVAEQISNFIENGGKIIEETQPAGRKPTQIYAEMTPNPATMKFVANFMLSQSPAEFKNIDQTASSPLARALFEFPYFKEIYIDENYVSVTKYDLYDWNEITFEIREFIRQFLENGGIAVDRNHIDQAAKPREKEERYENLDDTARQIVSILDEYVKPAVAADGGNIVFNSWDPEERRVKVILQGACNGCPSSTFTLKSGIENMLKDMLRDDRITVEALNG